MKWAEYIMLHVCLSRQAKWNFRLNELRNKWQKIIRHKSMIYAAAQTRRISLPIFYSVVFLSVHSTDWIWWKILQHCSILFKVCFIGWNSYQNTTQPPNHLLINHEITLDPWRVEVNTRVIIFAISSTAAYIHGILCISAVVCSLFSQ